MRLSLTLPFFALLLVAATVPFSASAATCTFTRDLEIGVSDGEDIRCLQQYLNSAGFPIAASGVGSKGSETPQFKEKTKEAVMKWQAANKLSPATGYFGPLSRAKYKELASGTIPAVPATPGVTPATPATPGNETALQARLQALLSQVERLKAGQGSGGGNEDIEKMIMKAINAIQDAEDQIEDSNITTGAAVESVADARKDLYTAIEAYFDDNTARAEQYADEAYDNAVDAYEDAGGESEEDDVDEQLEKVEDAIDDAEEQIEDADDDGKDVEEAEELLDEAKEKFEEAQTAFDDEEYDDAGDLAEEAEDLVNDAIKAIGSDDDEDSAEEAIEDAEDAIDEAREAIIEADNDGEDTEEAEDLLEEAEDKLEEAEEAFDDEDFDDAKELAEEAQELAEDALDEL